MGQSEQALSNSNCFAPANKMEEAQPHEYVKVEGKGSEARKKISGAGTKKKDERETDSEGNRGKGGNMLHAVLQIFPM